MACKICEVPGRGRGLIAERPIQAGEVVLRENAVFLIAEEEFLGQVCSACLAAVPAGSGEGCACQGTFCCRGCREFASNSLFWHPPHVCQALQRLDRSGLTSEDATSLRLLIHLKAAKSAASLPDGDPSVPNDSLLSARNAWNVVSSLCHGGTAGPYAHDFNRRLSQATGDAAGMAVGEVEELLRKEAANSYGIMAPFDTHGERQVRGSGIYAVLSLLNHDCLPNLARFDAFDASTPGVPGSTEICFRALHDIPAGEELTASYFPLTLSFQERQQRCFDLYGFHCSCPRCQQESTWSEEEGNDDMEGMSGDQAGSGGEAPMEPAMGMAGPREHSAGGSSTGGAHMAEESAGAGLPSEGGQLGPVDDSYIQVFMVKYVCPQEGCGGTLAPLHSTDWFQCNMCSFTRTEAEFLEELKEYC